MKKGALQLLAILLLYAYCIAAMGPSPPVKLEPPPPPPEPPPYNELYFGVSVNNYDEKYIALFLEDKQHQYWVSGTDLKAWNITLPTTKPLRYNDVDYYNVSAIPGMAFKENMQDMTINLNAPVDSFNPTILNAQGSSTLEYTLPSPGGFLNYNFFGTTADSGSNQYSLLYTLGIFNQYGVGTGNFLSSTSQDVGYVLRLTTTWTYDKPDVMQTWNFGDTTSTASAWSGSVNYGGIQWSTNFATQPYFLTFPQKTLKGTAVIPSTVDMFVNSNVAFSSKIPPGRFVINNIPLIDGLGNIRMVVKDVQGRDQVVNVPYYSSIAILKKGLRDFSYDFGILRRNLGLNSNDYAQAIFAMTESYGVSDVLTVQFHGEALPTQQAIGLNASRVVYPIGVFSGTVAASRSNTGDGVLGGLGYQFESLPFNFGLNSQFASNHFTQQAIPQGQYAPKVSVQIFSGFNIGSIGSLAITYTRLLAQEVPSISLLTASFSGTFFKEIGYSLTWVNSLGGPRNNTLIANLTYSFGVDDSGSSTAVSFNRTDQNDLRTNTMQLTRYLPSGPGYGYNITSTRGNGGASTNTNNLSLSVQNNIGTLIGQVNASQNEKYIYQLNASGAVVRLDERLYLTRTLTGSFGVVKLGDFKNVDIYANNLVVATTDSRGNALVPNLQPYNKTELKFDANQLPFSAQIGETKRTVAPYNMSGIVVQFTAKEMQSAIMEMKQVTGDYVPTGATVMVEGQTDPYIVADNGQTYLTNLGSQNKITITWPGHICHATISLSPPSKSNPIPDLGAVVCKE